MASEPSSSTTQPGNNTDAPQTPDQLTVNLQIVSPSVGVNRPLLFPGLAATTTIKQLKGKIRETLPLRPADENQRLIHRGRALVREDDSLEDILGAESLRSPDRQTIHLVIRDSSDGHTSAPPSSTPGTTSAAPAQPAAAPRQHVHHHPQNPFGPQPPPGFQRRNPLHVPSHPFPQPRMPSPSPAHTPEQAAAFQQQHQPMAQWLTHIQREAMARAVSHNQRARAQMGMRGIGDATTHMAHTHGEHNGRTSPVPVQTIHREIHGPDGRTYHFETVVRGGSETIHRGPDGMTPLQLQNMLRAEANQVALARTGNMRRSTSNASLHSLYNRPLNQPGVTTSVLSNPASGRATPDPHAGSRSVSGTSNTTATITQSQSRQGVELYILNSPEGPRAVLMNHASSETFYTPRLRTHASFPQLRYPSPYNDIIPENLPHGQDQSEQRHVQQPPQQQQQQQVPQPPAPAPAPQPVHRPEVQIHAPVEEQNAAQIPIGRFHAGNPPAAVIPPLLLQVWPQLWLLFRLALFVWFFTSPNATWSRWLTIICVAVFIFLLSTGLLNGFADHAWRPLGRQLENLIPPLDGLNGQQQRQEPANGQNGQNRQPDPADMAARLVAGRQRQESWLFTQFRRLERAGLLFLASIAPGVAERHIAHLEAEATAARERLEAERREAEAATAAAAQENEENAEGSGDNTNTGEQGGNSSTDTQGGGSPDDAAVHDGRRDEPVQEPLIAV